MAKKKRRSQTKNKKKFNYKARSTEQVKARADQSAGGWDSYTLDRFSTFRVKENVDHTIRVMPPTWDDPQHYGMELWIHDGIGPNNGAFPCLLKMRNEACPVCEEHARAQREDDDDDYIYSLKARKRVLFWMVDRDNESEGPVLWTGPWSFDRDLAAITIDKRSGSILLIDSPEEGYDVSFKRGGKKDGWKYTGLVVARRESPLADDEDDSEQWLDFIMENPIPDTIKYYDYDYMKSQLEASGGSDDDDDDIEDDEPAPKTRKEKKSKKNKKKVIDDEDEELDDDFDDEEEDDDDDFDDNDEDEELDDDFDDEEEDDDYTVLDEEEEDDEEEDDEEEDDEEEEEEPAPKRKKKSGASKRGSSGKKKKNRRK